MLFPDRLMSSEEPSGFPNGSSPSKSTLTTTRLSGPTTAPVGLTLNIADECLSETFTAAFYNRA